MVNENLAKDFQKELWAALSDRFCELQVRSEWAAFTGTDRHYSPRLDVAVGPFATGALTLGETYTSLVDKHHLFLKRLCCISATNLAKYNGGSATEFLSVTTANYNARCLIAIEIENRVSRKHLMGGAINASALGRIGLAIGWTDEKVKALVNVRRYLQFLAGVSKSSFDVANLLVLSREQLIEVINTPDGL